MNFIHQNLGRCCLYLLAATASAHAQPQRMRFPAPKETVLPTDPVDVRMHRFVRLPAVDVTINGRGPFRLIVDTGAAGVILKSEVADMLNLPAPPGLPPGGIKMQLVSPGGPLSGSLGYIESLELGGAVFRGVWTVGVPLPFGDDTDGVLGMNIFNECLLTYDYPNNRIKFSRGELPPVNGRDILPFSTPMAPGSHPIMEIMVGGKPRRFLIDTGMRGWFAMPVDLVKNLGFLAGPVSGMRGLSAGGAIERQIARLNTTVTFGHVTVEKPLVSFASDGSACQLGTGMVLGTMLLEHFAVTFDARNNRVRFARESNAPITPPNMHTLGLGLRRKGASMEVWAVYPNSHAASLGITEESLIHEINGQPAVELYRSSEWHALLQSADTMKLLYSPNPSAPKQLVEVEVMELP